MTITIIWAFIAVKRALLADHFIKPQLEENKSILDAHDEQLTNLSAAFEKLLEEKAQQQYWQKRERIGFKKLKYD